MKLSSKSLAVIVLVFIFGGIIFTSAMGWWTTVTLKVPVKFTEGEAAGEYNPADIRGSYTFGDIQKSFGIPVGDLANAFQIPANTDPALFQVKSLEGLYAEMEEAIDTSSMRLFVALYKGLPVDLSAGSYLLPEAVEILREQGKLTANQEVYLTEHTAGASTVIPAEQATIEVDQLSAPIPLSTKGSAEVPTVHVQPVGTVTGKTTFQQLLDMGVPKEKIEGIIGEAIPSPDTIIKDFITQKGLTFSSIKSALQAEVDK